MGKIAALAIKDLRLLARDRAGFFFTVFFPVIIAVMFGAIFGGSGEHTSAIPIVVADEDNSPGSKAFIDSLVASPELGISIGTREQGADRVRRGKAMAYVAIKPGFGEASSRMFWGAPPAVDLGVDPARRAEAGMIEGVLMKYAAKRFQTLLASPEAQRRNLDEARAALDRAGQLPFGERRNLDEMLGALTKFYAGLGPAGATPGQPGAQPGGFEPISIQKVDVAVMRIWPASTYAITFPQGIIWGFIGVTAAFGISIVSERTRGTLLRLQVASISRWQILAGKALACFIAAISVSAGLLALACLAFGVRPGSWPLLVLAVVSSTLGFVGLMMLLSVLGKTEEAASGIGWAVLLVFSMLGGGMVPYFMMPSWMAKISNFSLVKWSVLALEGAIWRHFSPAEMLLPCGILIGAGAVLFAVGVRAFSWAQER